jgi:vacuolar-type H+-ATPase subunit D/Vma8
MSNVIIPSSPEDRKKIRGALEEISNSLTRIEAERELIKEILQDVEDKFELPKKYTRKVAKIFHKQNFAEVKTEQEDLETIYETVTGPQP